MIDNYFEQFSENIEIFNPIKNSFYEMPTKVIIGRNSLLSIFDFIEFKNKKVILIISEHLKRSSIYLDFNRLLSEIASEIIVYNENISETNFETINKLVLFCNSKNPDIIISIGGGTIIDAGKCASVLTRNEGKIEDYFIEDKKIANSGVFFVAIPTTAGTGSEVTPWATVWDKNNKKKYSLSSFLMFPNLSVVDSSLIDDLPEKITADTGMDALAQAIEAYWSIKHNSFSDIFALEAIKMIMNNLEVSVKEPTKKSRDNMAKASLLTGLAFSNTKTTICHSISYPITVHFNVSHGQAVSLTLPLFIEYILPILENERRNALLSVLDSKDEKEAASKINSLMIIIGMKTKFSELGITGKDIDLIVNEGFSPDRANNSPRIPSVDDLKKMLYLIY